MRKVGIIGLGLIGGSLAKALKKHCGINDIIALGRNEAPLKQALADGAITGYTTVVDATFADRDIIFLCTPVDKIVGFVESLIPVIKPDCIVTDVGSTKLTIYEKMMEYPQVRFIGGHPMAGSEKVGYTSAQDILFENAFYLLTPSPSSTQDDLDTLREIITKIGALPIVAPPGHHDHCVAAISHAPHVIAAALVNTVYKLDDEKKTMYTLAAGGFRDITRIASSSPDMWSSISFENKDEILKVLESFRNELSDFEENIRADRESDIFRFYQDARDYRDSFAMKNSGGYMKVYEIFVDIPDKAGMIATIATLLSANDINIKNIGIVNSREYENGVLQILFDTEENMRRSISLLTEMRFTVYHK